MTQFSSNTPSDDADHQRMKKRKKKFANPAKPRVSDEQLPTGRSPRQPRHAASAAIPSRDEIKMKLAQLPVMLMAGIINPAYANSMRATFQTLLQADKADGATPVGGRELSVAAAALQADPRLAQLLVGFLSDDEIEMITRQAGADTSSPDESRDPAHKPKPILRKSGDEHGE